MFNKVFLLGRIGKDAAVKHFQNDQAAAEFSLATSNSYKNKDGEWVEETEWHNIKIFGKGKFMETVERRAVKGAQVFLEGKVKTRSYDDRDGNKKYITEIVCDTIKFLDKQEGGNAGVAAHEDDGRTNKANAADDDSLPF